MSNRGKNKHRGWTLVETGRNYYHACKGPLRVAVGSVRHGDREELSRRFKAIVDSLEGK